MPMNANSRTFRLAFIFLVGFAALIYQIYSVRILFMFFIENTRAVAIAVSSFLAGIACSSFVFSRLTRHNTRNMELLCFMALAAGVYGYAVLTNYQWVPIWLDGIRANIATPWLVELIRYAIMWLYLFPPAFFLGGAFPLVNGLHLETLEESSRDTGTVYCWDTAGAIAGALFAGFVLLPMFGLRLTVTAAAGINFLLAALLMPKPFFRYVTLVVLCGMVAVEIYQYLHADEQYQTTKTGYMVPVDPLVSRPKLFGKIIFQEESPYGRITVGKNDSQEKTLFINYRPMCSNLTMTGEREIAAMVMSEMKPDSRMVNIGLGCGFTASEIADHPLTKRLDIIEINPIIPKAAHMFGEENHNVLENTRAMLTIQDGAAWLRNSTERYDGIVIDIEEVSVIYSSPLYTKEYFKIARNHLTDRGVFALWAFTVSPEFTKVMYNTLASVFPYVVMRHENVETTYYAAMHPLHIPPSGLDYTKKVMIIPINSVNMLEIPVLEKYFNINKFFSLPDNYREDFVRQQTPAEK